MADVPAEYGPTRDRYAPMDELTAKKFDRTMRDIDSRYSRLTSRELEEAERRDRLTAPPLYLALKGIGVEGKLLSEQEKEAFLRKMRDIELGREDQGVPAGREGPEAKWVAGGAAIPGAISGAAGAEAAGPAEGADAGAILSQPDVIEVAKAAKQKDRLNKELLRAYNRSLSDRLFNEEMFERKQHMYKNRLNRELLSQASRKESARLEEEEKRRRMESGERGINPKLLEVMKKSLEPLPPGAQQLWAQPKPAEAGKASPSPMAKRRLAQQKHWRPHTPGSYLGIVELSPSIFREPISTIMARELPVTPSLATGPKVGEEPTPQAAGPSGQAAPVAQKDGGIKSAHQKPADDVRPQ